jgi:hypothetical protein
MNVRGIKSHLSSSGSFSISDEETSGKEIDRDTLGPLPVRQFNNYKNASKVFEVSITNNFNNYPTNSIFNNNKVTL